MQGNEEKHYHRSSWALTHKKCNCTKEITKVSVR